MPEPRPNDDQLIHHEESPMKFLKEALKKHKARKPKKSKEK